jgi:hypothetical protein
MRVLIPIAFSSYTNTAEFLTTDCADPTDIDLLYPCHPCDPWLMYRSYGRLV